jgi:hypothetical protein
VKAAEHLGKKKWEYMTDKINVPESKYTNKNIRDLYRGIKEFKEGTNLE